MMAVLAGEASEAMHAMKDGMWRVLLVKRLGWSDVIGGTIAAALRVVVSMIWAASDLPGRFESGQYGRGIAPIWELSL